MATRRVSTRGRRKKSAASRSSRLTRTREDDTEQPSVVTANATPNAARQHSSAQVSSVITITGLGDHDQPDWLITMTGIHALLGGGGDRLIHRAEPATGRLTRWAHFVSKSGSGLGVSQ